MNNNQLDNIDLLSKFTSLLSVKVNNNRISNLNPDIFILNNNLNKIDFSNNPINNRNYIEKISQRLEIVFLDKESIKYFSKTKNQRSEYSKGNYKFIKSLNIIIKDQLEFIDFMVQIEFLRRNIHLNLYHQEQIERFIALTSILEFQF